MNLVGLGIEAGNPDLSLILLFCPVTTEVTDMIRDGLSLFRDSELESNTRKNNE